jgi:uncharacterized membrane protein YcaP (DUF421 family)
MKEVYKVLLFSAIGFVYLFIMSKALGKKQIAHLDVIDYILGIAVSSIAAEMAVDTAGKPLYLYIAALSFFFALNLLVIFLERKGRFFKKFLKGTPLMVIYDGQIRYAALKKSRLDIKRPPFPFARQGLFRP